MLLDILHSHECTGVERYRTHECEMEAIIETGHTSLSMNLLRCLNKSWLGLTGLNYPGLHYCFYLILRINKYPGSDSRRPTQKERWYRVNIQIVLCPPSFFPILIIRKVNCKTRRFPCECCREADEEFWWLQVIPCKPLPSLQLNLQPLIRANNKARCKATSRPSQGNALDFAYWFWQIYFYIMECPEHHWFFKAHPK